MTLEVVNVVAVVTLGVRLDLEALEASLGALGQATYVPERFPGLVLKTKDGVSMLVFRSGKVVVAGAKNFEHLKNVVAVFISHIKDKVTNLPRTVMIQIQNIVITGDLGRTVNLELFSRRVPNAFYEPEQFPGAVYRSGIGKPVALLFSSGRVVLVGCKDEKEAVEVFEELRRLVNG